MKPSFGNESVGVRNRELRSLSSAFRRPTTQRHLELIGLVAASVFIWWHGITATLKLAIDNDAHTHILLIVPISVVLIYLGVKKPPMPTRTRGWIGAVLLGAALLLRGYTAWNACFLSPRNCLSFTMIGLVLWWIGAVIICFGGHAFRALQFPLIFLFLAVPLPEQAVNAITQFLQHQSAVAAELLFRVARVPVTREGVFLSIPGLDIEVAHECSSIRSSTMLIVITVILAHMFLRSWWRRTLLVVASIPLSVGKNAVRIFTIGELGTRVDPGYLTGNLHRNGGVIFLSLALSLILILLWVIKKE